MSGGMYYFIAGSIILLKFTPFLCAGALLCVWLFHDVLAGYIPPFILPFASLFFAVEVLFYPAHMIDHWRLTRIKDRSPDEPSLHALTTLDQRRNLLRWSMEGIASSIVGETASFRAVFLGVMSQWFYGADPDTILHMNIIEWLTWAFYDKDIHHLTSGETEELEYLLLDIEKYLDQSFDKGYNPQVKCIRLSLDPVFMEHRPLIYYVVILIIRYLCRLRLYWVGYSFRREPTGAGQYLQYYYRPASNSSRSSRQKERPIVLLHGIGIGLATYLKMIESLSPDVPVYLIDQRHISTVLFAENVINIADTVDAISRVLKQDGVPAVTLIAHSYGTAVASWLLKKHSEAVNSVILVDPICFLLCEPTLVHSFVHRKPITTVEMMLYYFVSKELYISHTLSRHFSWSHAILFGHELPTSKKFKNLIILAGSDALVPTNKVRRYLDNAVSKEGQGPLTSHTDVVWVPGAHHGEMFFRPDGIALINQYTRPYSSNGGGGSRGSKGEGGLHRLPDSTSSPQGTVSPSVLGNSQSVGGVNGFDISNQKHPGASGGIRGSGESARSIRGRSSRARSRSPHPLRDRVSRKAE